ncbi:hypothetical protein KQI84_10235 [bacterium]|nr:hypothetical protein [bacterium]
MLSDESQHVACILSECLKLPQEHLQEMREWLESPPLHGFDMQLLQLSAAYRLLQKDEKSAIRRKIRKTGWEMGMFSAAGTRLLFHALKTGDRTYLLEGLTLQSIPEDSEGNPISTGAIFAGCQFCQAMGMNFEELIEQSIGICLDEQIVFMRKHYEEMKDEYLARKWDGRLDVGNLTFDQLRMTSPTYVFLFKELEGRFPWKPKPQSEKT